MNDCALRARRPARSRRRSPRTRSAARAGATCRRSRRLRSGTRSTAVRARGAPRRPSASRRASSACPAGRACARRTSRSRSSASAPRRPARPARRRRARAGRRAGARASSFPVRSRTNPTPRPSGPSAVRVRGGTAGDVPAWSTRSPATPRGADDRGRAGAASASRSTRRPARAGPRLRRAPHHRARRLARRLALRLDHAVQGAHVVLEGIEAVRPRAGAACLGRRRQPRATGRAGGRPPRNMDQATADGVARPSRRPQPLRAAPSDCAAMTLGLPPRRRRRAR